MPNFLVVRIVRAIKMRNKNTHKSDNGVWPILPTSPKAAAYLLLRRKNTQCVYKTLTLSHKPIIQLHPKVSQTEIFLTLEKFSH